MLPFQDFPYTIVLGSNSPRRRELLASLGFEFETRSKDIDESYPLAMPRESVPEYLAHLKSMAFTEEELPENYLLITGDTMVLLDDKPLHKPKDRDQAIRSLYALSGQTHKVITGLSLRTKEKQYTFSVESKVTFRVFSLEEIEYYVDKYKPYDKAGAYGIQEWIGYVGIESVEGSFYNVMGLPTQRLYRVLSEIYNAEKK
ncbi:MAG: Maf family nucleotide pyrophosphatase [Bacteroidales bacterium]|nr:Maf family nucleotide pyrophosphatase [Bacteroidales bacterium]MDE7072396.1 Maf family nucleotide pyrophosphatase [Bacteroidales bacterium]